MMAARILGVGVLGPGLPDWAQARARLAGESAWQHEPVARVVAPDLPRTEARRATLGTHLALTVASQAFAGQAPPDADLPSVWAAADSDLQGLERNCRSLTEDSPWISPHRFQNSVHNTPSGYWSITTGCHGPATSVCAGNASFAAGLSEALTTLAADHDRCLLVVHDEISPATLEAARRVPFSFAAAFLLGRDTGADAMRVSAAPVAAGDGEATRCVDPGLEAMRGTNPAARTLPLLCALAAQRAATIDLPWTGRGLRLELQHGEAAA